MTCMYTAANHKYLLLFVSGNRIDEVCFNGNGMGDIKTGNSELKVQKEHESIKMESFE